MYQSCTYKILWQADGEDESTKKTMNSSHLIISQKLEILVYQIFNENFFFFIIQLHIQCLKNLNSQVVAYH